jgi:tRNA G10  N-methylase Trm11
MQSLCILGRQPALGLAELESLYGPDKLRLLGSKAAIIDIDPCLLVFDRLGGSVKFGKVLTELPTTNWKKIEKFLVEVSPGHAMSMPEGKMQLGLSVVEFDISLKQLEATGLTLKNAIRQTGRSVRLVPNNAAELSSAQVIHNRLTGPTGWELVLIKDGNDRTVVAQTVKVQDIASYTVRDRGRPKRDARIGMLPPKLAQIIINLAVGQLPEDMLESICEIPAGDVIPRPQLGQTILDPFCGTGVVLQEALLMGYDAYGTDLEPRMIDYSKENLSWLMLSGPARDFSIQLSPADAITYEWQSPIDFVASEAYLGRPFTAQPSAGILNQTVFECNLIIKKFLKNIHNQLESGTRLCLAVPAWQITAGQFKHLPLVDQISDLGYNRVSFKHVLDKELLYFREGQTVARELLVLERK